MHEHVLMFSRRPRTGVYNPQKFPGRPYRSTAKARNKTPVYRRHKPVATVNTGDRHPTSILRFAKPASRDRRHPTQKPLGLMD